jgi:hypothetical protein
MYKPRGHKVYYYPDYPERARRVTHAEVASHDEAYKLASALNAKTRDTCREFEKNPTITTKQLQSEFTNLQKQIDSKLDIYVAQAKKATADFDAMVPMLDRMQAMLSQRGKLRELMDSAKLPTWTQWFESFRKRLDEDVTLRTIQRKLREYRGGAKKSERQGKLHIDRIFLKKMHDTAVNSRILVQNVNEWLPAFKPKDAKELEHWEHKMKGWQSFAKTASENFNSLEDEIGRRYNDYGLRLPAGELLIVGKKKYRVVETLTSHRVTLTKKKGEYRINLLVREEQAFRKLRKRETCPECGLRQDITDGKFLQHHYLPGPRKGYCAMSNQSVVLDERGNIVNTAEKAKAATP